MQRWYWRIMYLCRMMSSQCGCYFLIVFVKSLNPICPRRVWISSADVAAVVEKGYRIVHAASDFFYLDCGGGGWVGENVAGNSWCDPFKTWQKVRYIYACLFSYYIINFITTRRTPSTLSLTFPLPNPTSSSVVNIYFGLNNLRQRTSTQLSGHERQPAPRFSGQGPTYQMVRQGTSGRRCRGCMMLRLG